MSFRRLIAIAIIFFGATVAWGVLGTSVVTRSGEFSHRLEEEVEQLWGAPHRQVAPTAWFDRIGEEIEVTETKTPTGQTVKTQVRKPRVTAVAVPLESTRANVTLDLEHRQRGLLWYPTYGVAFDGRFTFRNPDGEPRTMHVRMELPAQGALFDDFLFSVNGVASIPEGDISKALEATTTVAAGGLMTLEVGYRSRGLRTWTYRFADDGAAQVRDFSLAMQTNFRDIDFPGGSVSPTQKAETAQGWALTWAFSNLISGQSIGMLLPQKLNPGPFAARVTFFAPVSLLFFLAVMVMLGATRGPSLHPMHYWFIAAAFFAFHLLLAYLVDHVGVHAAFATSAAVSLLLVVSYLRAVTGMRHSLLVAGTAQMIFLVLFSYAFFFEGFTGLTVTIGAIVTLFVLMQMTAHVSWDHVFTERSNASGV